MNDSQKMRRVLISLLLLSLIYGCNPPQPPAENTMNVVSPTPASTRTLSSPTPAAKKAPATLFVPDENGNLKRIIVQNALPITSDAPLNEKARNLIALLMQRSPRDFPKGSRILPVEKPQADGKTVTVNFNQEFAAANFWQGATQTRVTIYAIVNTIAHSQSQDKDAASVPVKVRFLIEGKPIQTLGELDLSDPIEPDLTLVQKP